MAKKDIQSAAIADARHNQKTGEIPVRKQRRSNRCKICNTKTYQKDGTCVLCRTGINQKYDELSSLIREHKQWTFLKQT